MDYKIIGTSFGNGIAQASDVYSEDERGRITVTSTYRTLWANWITSAPARGTAHAVYTTATLTTRECKKIEPGFLCDVTLTYISPTSDAAISTSQPLPPDEYQETANEVEMPIEAHPDFVNMATPENGVIWNETGDFKGWQAWSPFAGYMTFKVGSISESTTQYSWSKPSSVTGLIGTRAGNWLTIGGGIARRYPYWTRTITRLYSSIPWNSTIYP
ncbi:MAG: hypothetical protein WCS65_17400 [Verrucomicrobiae bacterium]